MKKGFKALVAEAESLIEAISPEKAQALHGTQGVIFIDLREKGELRRDGVVPGAVHVPRGMLEFWIDPESPYFKPELAGPARYVFFCAAGWRSALATRTALEMGVGEVCHIDGGFAAWKASGGAVDTSR